MAHDDKDDITGVDTTGHEWDGIKELNNPLPRWWLWTFYVTIIWGVGYTIAFPAWPLISSATGGMLGYSTRAEVAAEIESYETRNAALTTRLASVDLTALSQDQQLHSFAVSGGAALFRNNCSQCHGSGAAGSKGYPNLLDDDWLWGGTIEDIAYTVRHGIRDEVDDDARYSEMPAFGELLEDAEIDAATNYVLSLSDAPHEPQLAEIGAGIFEENCASCHGSDGAGDPDQGAPNLKDAIWLYGGDADAIRETIVNARFGIMPPWGDRLGEANVKALAAYVHQLGGGSTTQ